MALNIKGPLIVFLLTVPGCRFSMSDPQKEVNTNINRPVKCPEVRIKSDRPIDKSELDRWVEGCKRVYGPTYCLVSVEYISARDHYNIICKRGET